MTTEQKARAYDEALERAKALIEGETEMSAPVYYVDNIKDIFPELKESEDEKVRKVLIEFVKQSSDILAKENQKSMLAWLEKQKGYKPAGKVEHNLLDILKELPRETKLYSPMYGYLWLAEVDEKNEIITCYKNSLPEGCTRAILDQEDTVSFYSDGSTGTEDFNITKYGMLFLNDFSWKRKQKPAE